MISASLVIPTFNRRRDLEQTLMALRRQTRSDFEVIVVDNASTDGTAETLAALAADPSLPYRLRHRVKQPEGPAAARNLGAALADAAFLGFVDSDVTLADDWLAVSLAEMAHDPRLGAVGGPLIYAEDPGFLNSYGGAMSPIGLAWDAAEGEPVEAAAAARDVLWINSGAVLMRREALAATGGFDPRFFYAYEESDVGWRMALAGWRLRVVPEARAWHRVGDKIVRSDPRVTFHSVKNRLSSFLANAGPLRLARWGPVLLAYLAADAVLRPPRRAKVEALVWALRNIGGTIRRRRDISARRRVDDNDLAVLFESRLFPEVPLDGLRRRPNRKQRSGAATQTRDDRI